MRPAGELPYRVTVGPLLPMEQDAGRCGAARKNHHSLRLQNWYRAEIYTEAQSGHSLGV